MGCGGDALTHKSTYMTEPRAVCDHTFFREIDTEAKAYWLGFLAADGHVTRRNEVKLVLSSKDRCHLAEFAAAIGSPKGVRTNRSSLGYETAVFSLKSSPMATDLAVHGVVSGRMNADLSPRVAPEMVRHYWRGYVDGDGWVYSTTRPGGSLKLRIGVTASRETCDAFKAWCDSVASFTRAAVRPNGRVVWQYETVKRDTVLGIASALYDGATVSLPRKREAYASWL